MQGSGAKNSSFQSVVSLFDAFFDALFYKNAISGKAVRTVHA